MNAKSLTLLLVLAGAAVAVAAVALRGGASNAVDTTGKLKLIPALSAADGDTKSSTSDRRNAVASIRVQHEGQSYTLHKVGDTWSLQDKGDFPVQVDQVRKLVNSLGEATTIEPKTSDPAKYAKLGVQDFDAPESKSKLVTLADKDGKPIAQLIIGKSAESAGMQASKQVYVRRVGEAQSWLANLDLDVHEGGTDWLAKEVVKVPQDSVRSIEIRQPDGATLLVDRPTKDTKDFTLHDVPEGKEPSYPTVANSLATGLEYVNLEDVSPAGDVDFTTGTGPIARYTTFDGLVVTVTTKDQDGKSYASFVASYEAPPPAPATETSEGEATATPATKSPEEVQKEVETLNARLSKWAYVISSLTRTQVGKKMSELVKDPAPPPAIANPNADPSAADPSAADGGFDDGMGGNEDPVMIPSDLPPEIREQIKAHQASIGNKTIDGPPRKKPDAPADGSPADGTPPTPDGSTPQPDDGAQPPAEPDAKPPER